VRRSERTIKPKRHPAPDGFKPAISKSSKRVDATVQPTQRGLPAVLVEVKSKDSESGSAMEDVSVEDYGNRDADLLKAIRAGRTVMEMADYAILVIFAGESVRVGLTGRLGGLWTYYLPIFTRRLRTSVKDSVPSIFRFFLAIRAILASATAVCVDPTPLFNNETPKKEKGGSGGGGGGGGGSGGGDTGGGGGGGGDDDGGGDDGGGGSGKRAGGSSKSVKGDSASISHCVGANETNSNAIYNPTVVTRFQSIFPEMDGWLVTLPTPAASSELSLPLPTGRYTATKPLHRAYHAEVWVRTFMVASSVGPLLWRPAVDDLHVAC
jgi:hypothetical protein